MAKRVEINLYDWNSPEAVIAALAAAYGGMSMFDETDIVRAAFRRTYNNNWNGIDPEQGRRRAANLCTDAMEIFRVYWEDHDSVHMTAADLSATIERVNDVVAEESDLFYGRGPTARGRAGT